MSPLEISKLLERAVRVGGEKALAILPYVSSHIEKGRGDFATEADLASEKEIMAMLAAEAPGIPIVSEETGLQEIPGQEFFTVDPLDGTIIASRGCPEWGVCASFIQGGEVVAAASYQPVLQQMVVATKGKGCWVNGHAVHFGDSPVPNRFVLSVDVSYASDPLNVRHFIYQPAVAERILIVRNLACAVANTMELLQGRIDLYVAAGGGKIWDYAPSALMICEAGGALSDLAGNPVRWDHMPMELIMARSQTALAAFLSIRTQVSESRS